MLPLVVLTAFMAQNLQQLEAAAHRKPDAANMRNLAAAYVDAEEFGKASAAFTRASELYGKVGDPNAAKVLFDLAKRYKTSIGLYVERPASSTCAYPLAKFEPPVGCYLGVNIEREESARTPREFNEAIGKNHAIFFIYRAYGNSFPKEYARELRRLHAGLQIAFEPNGLQNVRVDDYLEGFARAARESRIPIFLRFASEMNGDWTYSAYGSDPELYREKFRMVASVMHSMAPNVAMVWCPNEIPEAPIPKYFPGDDAVDWVGVNFYSVIYNDGDRSRPAAWRNPVDALDSIYRMYSAKHPIMVGEWAATHRSVVDYVENAQFARDKIGQFYSTLPLLYPRVKAVHWLSMNTMRYADGPRKLNDFSLLADSKVTEKYRAETAGPYFLDWISADGIPSSPVEEVPLEAGMHIRAGAKIRAYARTYETSPKVEIDENGQPASVRREPGEVSFVIGGSGPSTVSVIAKDSKGRVAGRLDVKVVVE